MPTVIEEKKTVKKKQAKIISRSLKKRQLQNGNAPLQNGDAPLAVPPLVAEAPEQKQKRLARRKAKTLKAVALTYKNRRNDAV